MTTIKASEYSPNSPATPLSPLTKGQVTLLNKGAKNDISQRVKTIVQTHLGYHGTDRFRTTFTKKEVTFTLKDGPATENRTLKLVNGHWMLSHNSTTPAALDPTVEAEVNTLITEILANIGKASGANVPDPVHSTAAVDAVDGKVSSADDSEVEQIKVRLASLENQLRSNLTLEQSLKVQQQILDELIGLRSALEKKSHGNNAEKKELRRYIEGLQKTLEKSEGALQKSEAELRKKQAELESERQQFQRAWEAKHQQAFELNQKIDALEKEVSEKDAALKKADAELGSLIKQIEAKSKKIEQAAQKTAEDFKDQQSKWLANMDALDKQLQSVQSELDKTTKQLNSEKVELQRQVEDLQKTIEENKAAVQKSEAEFKNKQTAFDKQQSKLLSNKTKLEKHLENLQNELKTKEHELQKFKSSVEAEFERLQVGFNAEKKKFQDQYDKLKSQFELEATLSNFLSNESIPALQKELNEKDQKLKTAALEAQENESQLRKELKKVNQALEKSEEARLNIVAANNAKVEKMKRIIVQIDEQTTDLTSKLEAARTENYTFTQHIQDLQESLQEKKHLLEQSENDAALTKKRVAKLERENEHLNLVIENAEQEKKLEPAQSDRDVTRKQLELIENNLQYLQALEQLQGTDENGILSKENSSPQEKTATLDQETLPTQNPVLGSLQELAKTTDEDSKRTLEELQTSFQEKYQKMLWAELENLPDEAAIPSTENSNLRDKSSSAEQTIEMKAQEIALLSEQLAQAKQTQVTLQSTIEDLQSQLAQVANETKNAYQEATKKEAQLREELKDYEEIFGETNAKLTQATDNNTVLTEQLESANKLNTFARDHIQTLEKSLSEKDLQLEIAAKNITQIESLSKQLKTATLQQAFLESKIERYKADRADAEQLATEATSALREAEDDKSQMQAKLKELDMLLVEQELKTGEVEFELKQATEMQETLQAQNTDLISKLKSAEKATEDSTFTIQELQKSLRKKDGQLEDISIELETAKLDAEEAKLDAKIAVKEAKENAKKVNNAFVEAQRKIESLEGERSRLEAANDQAQREIRYLLPRVNDELDIEQQQALLTKKIEDNRS